METSLGRLVGLRRDGLQLFLGVPFARAPEGRLRFAPPEPPAPWSGTFEATVHPPAAPQNRGDALGQIFPDYASGQSEDCLRLNLWTPGTDDGRRPVLVWIHGGRFLHGSASERPFDGAALARRGDVVVVAIQYRLGPFGFADLPGVAGNLGLRDQIAALGWVQREIARFGGDPDNVTLVGQSAGSISAGALLAAPAARGLFHRAILQSGPPVALDPVETTPVRETLLRVLGAEGVASLRRRPVADILAAEEACATSPGRRPLGLPYMPVVDGDLIEGDPIATVAAGAGANVPLLIGTTRDEMSAYLLLDPETQAMDDATLRRRCEGLAPSAGAAVEGVEVYRRARRARGEPIEPRDLWFAMLADRHVRQPSTRLAEAATANGQASYFYRFDWVSPFLEGAIGACHSIDVPFVFGTLTDPCVAPFTGGGPEALALADFVQDAWLHFARHGRPGNGWPAYEPTKRATMILGASPSVEEAPGEPERRFWETALV